MKERVRAKVRARLGSQAVLGDDFSVDWRASISMGPLIIRGEDNGPAVVTVKRLSVRPRWFRLVRGSVEPGWVGASDVVIEAGENFEALRSMLNELRSEARAAEGSSGGGERVSTQLPEIEFERVVLRATVQKRFIELEADEGRLIIHRDPASGELHVEALLSLQAGGEVRASAAMTAEGVKQSDVFLRNVPLEPLGVQSGVINGELHLTSEERNQLGAIRWQLAADHVMISSARLSSETVGPMHAGTHGAASWDVRNGSKRTASLGATQLTFGPHDEIKLETEATYQLDDGLITVAARTVDLEYEQAVAAMPAAFAPGELSGEVSGPFSVKVDLKGPLRKPADWLLNAKIDLTALRNSARAVPHGLNKPFVYKTALYDGRPRELTVGPANPAFVPLAEVPKSLIRAVLLSEDSMFMSHQGFDFFEMKNDLFAENENGEAVIRGASTMTQQLAKNLFLSRERTYARKVKEAFLTIALEAAVPKERLLEIYLNIIEWGPGLNGLGEASMHYFGKRPAGLTVRESAYLATIIPGPIRYYGFFTKGELPEVWERRIADLLTKMHSAGDLSDEALAEALQPGMHFAKRP